MQIDPIFPSWGAIVHASADEVGSTSPSILRTLLYERKFLVLKGLHGLSATRLYDLHTRFGVPWTFNDYGNSFERALDLGQNRSLTTYGNQSSTLRIGDYEMPWHRDIPWHRHIRYPIRTLYPVVLENANTPTMFCDASQLKARLSGEDLDLMYRADLRIANWYQVTIGQDPEHKVIPFCEKHPVTGHLVPLLNCFVKRNEHHTFGVVPRGAWITSLLDGQEDLGVDLIQRYHELVCTEDNIYTHYWEPGDWLLFDNWSGVFHKRGTIEALDPSVKVNREFYRLNLYHPNQVTKL